MALRLGRRVLTAAVCIPAVYYCVRSDAAASALTTGLPYIASVEYVFLLDSAMEKTHRGMSTRLRKAFVSAALCVALIGSMNSVMLLNSMFLTAVACMCLLTLHDAAQSSSAHFGMLAATGLVFGLWFVPWCCAHFAMLRGLQHGAAWQWTVLCCCWNADNGALALGKLVRSPKLAPALSPGKTWAGLVGAIMGSVATAVLMPVIGGLLPALPYMDATTSLTHTGMDLRGQLGVGLLCALLGQAGDLVESVVKRAAGAKDSGTLFPGHGGALDRMDSIVLVAPTLFYVLQA